MRDYDIDVNEKMNLSEMNLSKISTVIRNDWKNVNFAVKPYLDAMVTLNSVDDNYMLDSGRSVVAYFLSNAGSWRGDVARGVKAHLNSLIK